MSRCRIDHIAITCPTLAAGSDYVYERLGVRPLPGGEHARMGTHNLLLRLGDSSYLEVIASNPAAPRPPRPRWFALDDLAKEARPRLACWVARTEDIHASQGNATEALGQVEAMSRGALQWLISIPDDGSLPLGGAAPALIQWNPGAHPAAAMPDLGCSLRALALFHPEPQRLQKLLESLDFAEPSVEVSVHASATPSLVAQFDTPHGRRTIGTS